MLSKLSREDETDGGLDFTGGDGRLLRVRGEFWKFCKKACNRTQDIKRTGCLGSDTLKDIVDEAVKDSHRLVRDTGIGMDLLEDYRTIFSCAKHQTRLLSVPL